MASRGPTPGRVLDALCGLDGDWHDGLNAHVSASVDFYAQNAETACGQVELEDDGGELIARYKVTVTAIELDS
jgi:hypothetical protein